MTTSVVFYAHDDSDVVDILIFNSDQDMVTRLMLAMILMAVSVPRTGLAASPGEQPVLHPPPGGGAEGGGAPHPAWAGGGCGGVGGG